jgi:hypothetical protein
MEFQEPFLSGGNSMKKMLVAAFLMSTIVLLAQSGKPQNTFTPSQIKWGPPPPFVARWRAARRAGRRSDRQHRRFHHPAEDA